MSKIEIIAKKRAGQLVRDIEYNTRQARAEYAREYYRKNRERVKAIQKKWRTENRKAYLKSQQKYNRGKRKQNKM